MKLYILESNFCSTVYFSNGVSNGHDKHAKENGTETRKLNGSCASGVNGIGASGVNGIRAGGELDYIRYA